jgi:ZIP family zinc transporter
MDLFLYALLLALMAGLSTSIGSVIAFFIREPSPKIICVIMGFSAGVMILVSFMELLQKGIESTNVFIGLLFFMGGMILMFLIDIFISHNYEFESSTETRAFESNESLKSFKNEKLQKTSILVTLGIMIHNFPEGIATFVGTLESVELGIILAVAIAIHNIPEGIAVSIPIYSSTGSRKKAFYWSFLSGISEFIGALVCSFILFPFINDFIIAAMLAIVGGFMVYISLDELLPVSHSYGYEHLSIIGIMSGMFIMGLSLALL